MATTRYYDSDEIPFPAAAAVGEHLRVKLDSAGKVAVAGGTDAAIGYTTRQAFAADEVIGVRTYGASTWLAVAAAAIAVGDKVYGDANGQVGVTATNVFQGIALTPAAAQGDVLTLIHGDDDH